MNNMNKEACENKSASLILLIHKKLTVIEVKQ